MKLQELHDRLEELARDGLGDRRVISASGEDVVSLGSYRGYYDQLQLTVKTYERQGPATISGLLAECKAALAGKVFHGYKGGDYVMHAWAPVWLDAYGECHSRGVQRIQRPNTDDGPAVVQEFDMSDYA